MTKVVLSDAMYTLFEYFAGLEGQETTLTKDEVVGLASAFGEMADYALELETAAVTERASCARAALVASGITIGGNVIVFPILPRHPLPAA
ncbi:hypothetical protein GCM10019059_24100 [Camelimonas fluminis]|uniref:Uncharacterized protein n=1 Tax=Camelimonas fluminis TaxID=1576911 RepID=A0ABV7UAZ3_9HYPH|nr:hypothetical protein [Camelimonas fluminis]GHE63782.1 hypothetical protein GCM10019059_24100 [Camelimonas fluminis]